MLIIYTNYHDTSHSELHECMYIHVDLCIDITRSPYKRRKVAPRSVQQRMTRGGWTRSRDHSFACTFICGNRPRGNVSRLLGVKSRLTYYFILLLLLRTRNNNVVTFDPANFGLLPLFFARAIKGHAIIMTFAGGEPGDEATNTCRKLTEIDIRSLR